MITNQMKQQLLFSVWALCNSPSLGSSLFSLLLSTQNEPSLSSLLPETTTIIMVIKKPQKKKKHHHDVSSS